MVNDTETYSDRSGLEGTVGVTPKGTLGLVAYLISALLVTLRRQVSVPGNSIRPDSETGSQWYDVPDCRAPVSVTSWNSTSSVDSSSQAYRSSATHLPPFT